MQIMRDENGAENTQSDSVSKPNELAISITELIAGSVGGVAQVCVSQPFDTVKVKQQTFPQLYKSMLECFLRTYQQEGIAHGLYSGTLPALCASVGECSVLFTAYGGCRRFVAYLMHYDNPDNMPIFGQALAGSFASFFSTFVLCPTELIKCKLQAINEIRLITNERNRELPQMTMRKIIRNIYLTDGIPGFYRGLTTTLVRELPGYFCFFGCYEGIRELFTKPGESKEDVGALVTIFAGAISGIMLWTVTFPADVIKSRIQVNNMAGGMFTVGKRIMQEEGVLALYTGLLPTVIRTIPSTAALFWVYEFTKKSVYNMLNN